MTNPYLKKCERCTNLFELPDHYESYKIPTDKYGAKFILPKDKYIYVDLCPNCLNVFYEFLREFIYKSIGTNAE